MTEPHSSGRVPGRNAAAARDAGLRRLSRLTRRAVAAAAALTGVFAAVAANALPGRSSTPPAHLTGQAPASATQRHASSGREDSGKASQTPAPAPLQPPAQAPTPAPAPPVAVSGGS